MKCSDCGAWVLECATVYADGTRIVNYAAPAGKGHCEILNLDTAPEFGCLSFVAGEHVRVVTKPGEPWQHWQTVPCPDCDGRGSHPGVFGHCRRCWGEAMVRKYDDGFVGENRQRRHPKEQPPVKPESITGYTLKSMPKKYDMLNTGTGDLTGEYND
jgi:hypothetical protein